MLDVRLEAGGLFVAVVRKVAHNAKVTEPAGGSGGVADRFCRYTLELRMGVSPMEYAGAGKMPDGSMAPRTSGDNAGRLRRCIPRSCQLS